MPVVPPSALVVRVWHSFVVRSRAALFRFAQLAGTDGVVGEPSLRDSRRQRVGGAVFGDGFEAAQDVVGEVCVGVATGGGNFLAQGIVGVGNAATGIRLAF